VVAYALDGEEVGAVSLNFDGNYQLFLPGPGTYFARASGFPLSGEVFLDRLDSATPHLDGSAISVPAGKVVSGIDFTLGARGEISGSVLDSGHPVSGVIVDLYDSSGRRLRGTSSVNDGSYTFSEVSSGKYFLVVPTSFFSTPPIEGQVYSGVPCPLGCDVTVGSPVLLPDGGSVSGIDFELRVDRTLTGTIHHQLTGRTLASVAVEAFGPGGVLAGSGFTGADGDFRLLLPPGSYRLRTRSLLFHDELYDDLSCEPDCDVTLGSTVDLTTVGPGVALSGIDFALAGCNAPLERTLTFFTFNSPTQVEACDILTLGQQARVKASVELFAGERVVLGSGFGVDEGGTLRIVVDPGMKRP
jgi:hypothetical protein